MRTATLGRWSVLCLNLLKYVCDGESIRCDVACLVTYERIESVSNANATVSLSVRLFDVNLSFLVFTVDSL